jgi:hypothetical protein
MLVMEHAEVPKTGYQRIKGGHESDEQSALGEEVGLVPMQSQLPQPIRVKRRTCLMEDIEEKESSRFKKR